MYQKIVEKEKNEGDIRIAGNNRHAIEMLDCIHASPSPTSLSRVHGSRIDRAFILGRENRYIERTVVHQ